MRLSHLTAVSLLLLIIPSAFAGQGKVQGTITYEKIPFRDEATGKMGLQLKNPIVTAVIGAKVELVGADGKVLGSTYTGPKGEYVIPWDVAKATDATVRVLALAKHVKIQSKQGVLYSFKANPALTLDNGDQHKDVKVTDASDLAGPFNIMEAIRRADTVLEKAQFGITDKLPMITVVWMRGDNSAISHFSSRNNQAFIMGDREDDSDEFDDFIIVHEYGHFIMYNFGFNDYDGSPHGTGNKLDPRLAWGEGWANFFACAILNDPLYIDTGKRNGQQAAILVMNLDQNVPAGDNPGYWSEHTVGSVLWDIMDDNRFRPNRPRQKNDLHLGVGFKEIWRIVTGPLKERRHVTIVDFCDVLVKEHPELGPGVTEVLKSRNIAYHVGRVPSINDPYHRPLQLGKEYAGTVDSHSTKYLNLDSNHFYTFTLDKKTKVKLHMKITASKTPKFADIDLYLYDKKGMVAYSNATNGVGDSETIEKILEPGTYYAQVKSYYNSKQSGSYTLKATVVEGK